MNDATRTPETTLDDMELIRAKTAHLLADPEHLPISFVLDGRKITGIPSRFNPTVTSQRIDANIVEWVYEGTDAAAGLRVRVECLEYQDFPVVEWTAWFENVGDENTPILSDILGLDADFEGASPVLYHCNGDFCHETGYTPTDTPLSAGAELRFAPVGGRPCDRAFPYYRVAFDGFGLTVAIGWPAQWSAEFAGTDDGVRIQAGQEITNLYLEPGERIRTPRMTVMAWMGETPRGINVWRRWYLEHVLPRHDGQPLAPQLGAGMNDADVPSDEFTKTNEKNQLAYVKAFHEKGFDLDVWWIDAGWYPSVDPEGKLRWTFTGDWRPDPERFPRGLKPISDAAGELGTDLLIWFEPERVQRGTRIEREHPDWVLRVEGDGNCCLNLGDAETCDAFTDYISKTIQDNGIRVYRQDYNFEPLKFWRTNDGENREGIRENLHVQGYLRYWDALLERNPGLWIDSCSSGGRRNDLETMRRSVPLHYSDYGYGLQYVKAGFHYTLYSWIPFFKDMSVSSDSDVDSYSIHSGFAAMTMIAIDVRRDHYDYPYLKKMYDIWRRASETLLYGDYYALTPFSNTDDTWTVRQFDKPELGAGVLHGFRHRGNGEDSITVHPAALRADADYTLDNPETGATMELSGAALLRDGFTFELPARSAAMWFYQVRD